MTYGAIYPYTWWGNRQDLGFGTSYPFLLNRYGGAAAAYSLRSLSSDNLNVVRVRRDSDNEERDFRATEVTDGTLQNWVNGGLDDLPLDTATAAAAYSLRNLKTSYSGSVVRVRRSSDNAEADFTAAEVADGTLENWVNTDVVIYESDFTSGNEDLTETNGIGTDGETIDGVSDAYKFTLTGGSLPHQTSKSTNYEVGKTYRISFDYYIPSTNQKVNELKGTGGLSFPTESTLDAWTSVSYTDVAISIVQQFRARYNGDNIIDADGDVFYLKNIVVTQTTADGHVTTWYDQAGSNNATQGTASSQPKIVDAGSLITENGKAAVSFDGVDDDLQVDIIPNISQPLTTFSVRRYRANGTYVALGFQPNTGGGYADINITNQIKTYYGAYLTISGFATTQKLFYSLGNGTSSEGGINGSLVSGNAGNTNLQYISIGSAYGAFNAPINQQEVIIYDSDQSTNRTKIENNISTYYDIYDTSANGYVATWYDQSVNGNDATQATASAQPQIVSNGVIITENGKAALDFDGISNYLESPTFGISGTIERSFFALALSRNITYGSNGRAYIGIGNGSSGTDDQAWEISHEHSVRIYGGNVVYGAGVVDTQYLTTNICAGLNVNDNNLWVNGSEQFISSSTPSTYNTINTFNYIGKTHFTVTNTFFDGPIQEIIVYPSDQSTNRADIESEINTYYTIYAGSPISGLLYDYPSSAAAYSVRQLTIYDNDYKETLVKVRRSSDNAEVDVKADTNYEISLNSFTSAEMSLGDWIGSDDGYVVTWYDQSGNDNDATQATASSQPQLISGGVVNLENGKASLNFDGTDDYMTSPSVALSTNNIALFNILKLNSSTFATWFSYGGYILNGFLIQRPNNSYARYAVSGSSYEDFNDFSSLPSTTNQILLSLIDYDSNSSVYIDNVLQGTKTISASLNSSKTIELGRRTDNNTQYTPMNAQEFIFYPTDQSANREGIETNINNYFNIY